MWVGRVWPRSLRVGGVSYRSIVKQYSINPIRGVDQEKWVVVCAVRTYIMMTLSNTMVMHTYMNRLIIELFASLKIEFSYIRGVVLGNIAETNSRTEQRIFSSKCNRTSYTSINNNTAIQLYNYYIMTIVIY